MLIFSIIVLAILFAIGSPIYMAFSIGGLLILFFIVGFPLNQLTGLFFNSLNSYVLLAGPLFILGGNLMMRGGLSWPLSKLMMSCTNRIPGGVAVATILACTFVGALTGSAFATIAAVGITLFPAMINAGYTRGYSGAVLCSAGNLGILIPPSIAFILFGYLTETSVGHLFIAGIIPGLIMAALLSGVTIMLAVTKQFPTVPGISWTERGRLFMKALPALFMPLVILGGIYGGVFTPTEAAAVACVYAIIVGFFVYRGFTFKSFWASLTDTTQLVGVLLLLIAGGTFLGKAFILIGFPQAVSNLVTGSGLGPTGFMLILAAVFAGLGCIMEGMVIMFVTLPLIVPAANMLGIDMLQLGVIFCISIMVSGVTPPVAIILYITSGMFQTPIEEIIREVFPFLLAMIISLVIVIFLPQLSVWLPGKML